MAWMPITQVLGTYECLIVCSGAHSTLGSRAACGPYMEDGLGNVITGKWCRPAIEAAPGRDWSYSNLDWDAIHGATGPMIGTHLYFSLNILCPALSLLHTH